MTASAVEYTRSAIDPPSIRLVLSVAFLIFLFPFFFSPQLFGSLEQAIHRGHQILFFIVGTVLILIWHRRAAEFVFGNPMYGILIAVFLISVYFGLNPRAGFFRTVQMVGFLILSLSFCIALGADRVVALLTIAFAGFVIVNAGLLIVDPAFGQDHRPGFGGTRLDKNLFGQVVGAAFLFLGIAGIRSGGTFRRPALIILSIVAALLLATSQSVAASIAVCVAAAAGLLGVMLGKLPRSASGIGLLLIAVAAIAGATIFVFMNPTTAVPGLSPTFSNRTTIWSAMLTVANTMPLLGTGFGSFWQTGADVNPFGQWIHIGWNEEWITDAMLINMGHNGYLDLYFQTGLIGLSIAALFLITRFRRAYRLACDSHPIGVPAMMAFAFIFVINFFESNIFFIPLHTCGLLYLLTATLVDSAYKCRRMRS